MVSASLDQTVRVWDIGGLRKKTVSPGGADDVMRLPQVGSWRVCADLHRSESFQGTRGCLSTIGRSNHRACFRYLKRLQQLLHMSIQCHQHCLPGLPTGPWVHWMEACRRLEISVGVGLVRPARFTFHPEYCGVLDCTLDHAFQEAQPITTSELSMEFRVINTVPGKISTALHVCRICKHVQLTGTTQHRSAVAWFWSWNCVAV